MFLIALPLLVHAQEPGYPQTDTLVIRRDSLDAARGVIRSIPDTIFFHYRADAIFPNKVSLEAEMTFKPLRITDTPVALMEHKADPVERLAKARAYRLGYHFEEAAKACQQAMTWADDALAAEVEKIAVYAGDRKNWTAADVDMLFSALPEIGVFALNNAITAQNTVLALQLLAEEQKKNTYLPLLIAKLLTHLRSILMVKEGQRLGRSASQIAAESNKAPFLISERRIITSAIRPEHK